MPWVRKTMGTQRHCLTFLVWGKWTCPCLPLPHKDIPTGALRLTGLWGGKQSCSCPWLSQWNVWTTPGGWHRVYTEGGWQQGLHWGHGVHVYSGYSEGLLPALHGPKKNLHGVCGLLVLWRRKSPGSWTRISHLFAWFFPMCKTLHRANLPAEAPEAWHWQLLHLHYSEN